MNAHPYEQLSDMLTTMGISKSGNQPELFELLNARLNADGLMQFSFPTNLKQQRVLARVWADYTHLNEAQMLELIQAMVVVLKDKNRQ